MRPLGVPVPGRLLQLMKYNTINAFGASDGRVVVPGARLFNMTPACAAVDARPLGARPPPTARAPADFTVDIAVKYIYRGYTVVLKHAPKLALLVISAMLGVRGVAAGWQGIGAQLRRQSGAANARRGTTPAAPLRVQRTAWQDGRLSCNCEGTLRRRAPVNPRHTHTHTYTHTFAPVQLELMNMLRVGQLSALWDVAHETNLTINLVRGDGGGGRISGAWRSLLHRRGARAVCSPPHPPPNTPQVTVVGCCSMLLAAVLSWFLLQTRPVYLVDFAVYRPPDDWRMDKAAHMRNTIDCGVRARGGGVTRGYHAAAACGGLFGPSRSRPLTTAPPPSPLSPAPQKFTARNIEFQEKILARGGLGDETYLPPGLKEKPPAISMSDARWEFEQARAVFWGGGWRGAWAQNLRAGVGGGHGMLARTGGGGMRGATLQHGHTHTHTHTHTACAAGVLQRDQGGAGQDRRAPAPGRRRHRQLQPVQPDAQPERDDHEPLQDGVEHHQLQPRRHGLLG